MPGENGEQPIQNANREGVPKSSAKRDTSRLQLSIPNIEKRPGRSWQIPRKALVDLSTAIYIYSGDKEIVLKYEDEKNELQRTD